MGTNHWQDDQSSFQLESTVNTVIQCYVPTNEAEEEEVKDTWYEQVQLAVSKVPQHDMLMITEDINAKVGAATPTVTEP